MYTYTRVHTHGVLKTAIQMINIKHFASRLKKPINLSRFFFFSSVHDKIT